MDKDRKVKYLSFMSGSTPSNSLNPIPQGLPGVASSMNLPNSGWKTGRGFDLFILSRDIMTMENPLL